MDVDGKMVWVEEDYCSPQLVMERGAVLDRYFTEKIPDEQAGWNKISSLLKAW